MFHPEDRADIRNSKEKLKSAWFLLVIMELLSW